MEFAGFQLQHQHQLQEESPPPHYKPSSTDQSWIPCNIYNGCTSGLFLTESFTDSKELGHKHAMIDSLRTSKEKAFGFHDGKHFTQHPASHLLPAQNFYHHVQKSIDEAGMALTKRYNINSIPNLSTLDMKSSLISCSLGLNSQMLDLHTSCGLQLCYDTTFGLNEGISYSNTHGREHSPSNSSNKVSTLTSEVAMTNKRPTNCSGSKESEAKANKKSRPSCPPLKVRKEKLGDRIQTLQRLVAPCGKTSTASVLTEAIGYIHFLHEQIQTLSLPYIKSAKSKPYRMVQLDSRKVDNREFKPDLRSGGLCLVPLSYASFIHRCA